MTLRQRIEASFRKAVLDAVAEMSVEELIALTGAKPGVANGMTPNVTINHFKPAPSHRAARRAKAVARPKRSAPKAAGRLARRSPAEIAKGLTSIVALVKKKGGLRSEQIRDALGLQPKEMPRLLKEGLTTKKLRAKGHKRSTVYSAVA